MAIGTPFGPYNLRWIEEPENLGFRFVGFADEIVGRGIDHDGWFTHPDGDTGETLRGAVYRLPAKGGHSRYVAGYQWERRLHPGSSWYYGWDCASGCIWNPDAIRFVGQPEPVWFAAEKESAA